MRLRNCRSPCHSAESARSALRCTFKRLECQPAPHAKRVALRAQHQHQHGGASSEAPASLYELLGVSSRAQIQDIKSAYRSLASQLHPDVNSSPDAQQRFQAVNLAVEVLSDPQLRGSYDTNGLRSLGARYSHLRAFVKEVPAHTGSAHVEAYGVVDARAERGADISTVMGLEFAEAVTGREAVLSVGALGCCPGCQGDGCDAAAPVVTCATCRGTGSILLRRWQGGAGAPLQPHRLAPCPACAGRGVAARAPCGRCGGEGRAELLRRVTIRIPAGVQDGQVLRVSGHGHAGRRGGAAGDLYVQLQVYDLSNVQRRGDDLSSELALSVFDALLGSSIRVHTVRGEHLLQVPPGTSHGDQLRVERGGVARPGGNGVSYGDHIFDVALTVPRLLDDADQQPSEARALALRLLLQLQALRRAAAADDGGGHCSGGGQQPLYQHVFGLGGEGTGQQPG